MADRPQLLAFKALANPARYRIVETLARDRREHPCREFIDDLGVTPPAVSNHLRQLEQARLVELRRRGTQIYASLAANDVAYQMAAFIGASRPPQGDL